MNACMFGPVGCRVSTRLYINAPMLLDNASKNFNSNIHDCMSPSYMFV